MKKSALATCILTVTMMTLSLVALPVHAQQSAQPSAQPDQQTEPETEQDADASEDAADSNDEPTDEQAQSDLPDIDNQPIQPESGGPGRFIPSEQISQDLGVSFPVDI